LGGREWTARLAAKLGSVLRGLNNASGTLFIALYLAAFSLFSAGLLNVVLEGGSLSRNVIIYGGRDRQTIYELFMLMGVYIVGSTGLYAWVLAGRKGGQERIARMYFAVGALGLLLAFIMGYYILARKGYF